MKPVSDSTDELL